MLCSMDGLAKSCRIHGMALLPLDIPDLIGVTVFWAIVLYRWTRLPPTPPPIVPADGRDHLHECPLVSILVPARNEERHIRACIQSLLAQDYPRFEIIAINDRSEDSTGPILEELAARDSRLTVIHGTPLPEGWMGKAHALAQGYPRATGEWLLFTDADTEHAPFLLSGVMALLERSPAALATVFANQRHPTPSVYLANLAVLSYLFLAVDLKGLTDPGSRQSLVNGQYVPITREAYESLGTHTALRRFSSTDVSLGYLAKREGWQPLLINARHTLQTTMYPTFADAFRGWSRSLVNGLWTAVGPWFGSLALLLFTLGLSFFWIGPWLLAIEGLVQSDGSRISLAGLEIMAGLAVLRMGREGWLSALRDTVLMPFAQMIFVAMVGAGLGQAWRYSGTVWKGRVVRTSQRLPPWTPKPVRPRQAHPSPTHDGPG